jgi:hypothetical protein
VSTAGYEYAENTVFWEKSVANTAWPWTALCETVGNPKKEDPKGEISADSKSNAFAMALLKAVLVENCVIVGKPNAMGDNVALAAGIKNKASSNMAINGHGMLTLIMNYPPPIKIGHVSIKALSGKITSYRLFNFINSRRLECFKSHG